MVSTILHLVYGNKVTVVACIIILRDIMRFLVSLKLESFRVANSSKS
ncbi:hypothetical protein BVRB_4g072810 [Beta vulgaris subsp. vulgaris]|nr:hypothetical protein BVRB_4g072810 [Beta vulgaris subsp. vulgaris]